MAAPDAPLADLVGVRFPPRVELRWYRAGVLRAAVDDWVMAELDGAPAVGQVVIGRGQCLDFPLEPAELPVLERSAHADEIPEPPGAAGQQLADSLP